MSRRKPKILPAIVADSRYITEDTPLAGVAWKVLLTIERDGSLRITSARTRIGFQLLDVDKDSGRMQVRMQYEGCGRE